MLGLLSVAWLYEEGPDAADLGNGESLSALTLGPNFIRTPSVRRLLPR